MVKELLTEENIRAYKTLGYMKVKNKSGEWLSYDELLHYALELKAKVSGENSCPIVAPDASNTFVNSPRIDFNGQPNGDSRGKA